ncbi:hypothetical protein MTO96_013624 [Rhipicephalus appendiculatus]
MPRLTRSEAKRRSAGCLRERPLLRGEKIEPPATTSVSPESRIGISSRAQKGERGFAGRYHRKDIETGASLASRVDRSSSDQVAANDGQTTAGAPEAQMASALFRSTPAAGARNEARVSSLVMEMKQGAKRSEQRAKSPEGFKEEIPSSHVKDEQR